jgi:cation-transporting ATPase 13A1
LKNATHVSAYSSKLPNQIYLLPITRSTADSGSILFRQRKYTVDFNNSTILKIKYPYQYSTATPSGKYFLESGFNDKIIAELRRVYGRNEYNIPVPTFRELFLQQALAPFFIFQVFCVLLWSMDDYFMYSLMTLVLLFVFEFTLTQSRLRNLRTIRQMANPETTLSKEEREIYSEDRSKKIPRSDILPGEVVIVGEGLVPADMILISGEVVVNESLLTGESTPLLKSSFYSKYSKTSNVDHKDFKPHIISAGTKVLQSRAATVRGKPVATGAVAKIIRTGWGTSQGKLVRTILESSTSTHTDWQSYGFILFLVQFALLASSYVLYHLWDSGIVSNYKVILNCILIVTSVVPPELPMELSLAINSSLVALHQKHIFCTEPTLIAVAGHVHTCCFDKTGTLTDTEMKMIDIKHTEEKPKDISKAYEVLEFCNTLVEVGGEWVGDGMERAARNWLAQKNLLSGKGKIIKRWDFESALRRMSVLISRKTSNVNEAYIYVKGAPETLKSRFINLPDVEKYDQMVTDLSNSGLRIIALGYKPVNTNLEGESWERDEADSNLYFAGLACFGSALKPHTSDTIAEMKEADMRCVMITGDNVLTACHVAKQCGISDSKAVQLVLQRHEENSDTLEWHNHITHKVQPFEPKSWPEGDLCVTGDLLITLETVYKIPLTLIVQKILIYARVAPNQKESILRAMRESGDMTLMCGDGTNDVGALKAANIGVALISSDAQDKKDQSTTALPPNQRKPQSLKELMEQQQTEVDEQNVRTVKLGDASIAAPFTSKLGTIGSAREILKQGRCTLVTTFQMYKILAVNCLLTAYSLSVLYLDGVKFTDAQMMSTGICIAMFFLFISRSQPSEKLAKERPEKSVWTGRVIGSVMAQFMVHLAVLICCVRISKSAAPLDALKLQSRFHVEEEDDEHVKGSLMNTIVFLVSSFQTLVTFVNNYRGEPFMQNVWKNRPLFISFLGVAAALFGCLMNWDAVVEFRQYMGLVNMGDYGVQKVVSMLIFADIIGVILVERLCRLLF